MANPSACTVFNTDVCAKFQDVRTAFETLINTKHKELSQKITPIWNEFKKSDFYKDAETRVNQMDSFLEQNPHLRTGLKLGSLFCGTLLILNSLKTLRAGTKHKFSQFVKLVLGTTAFAVPFATNEKMSELYSLTVLSAVALSQTAPNQLFVKLKK